MVNSGRFWIILKIWELVFLAEIWWNMSEAFESGIRKFCFRHARAKLAQRDKLSRPNDCA